MKSKPLTQTLITFSIIGCLACTPEETDPAPEPRDVPGAAIWFDSSVRAQVMQHSFYDTWGPDAPPPQSTTTYSCWELTSLSEEDEDALRAVRLTALDDGCTVDGYWYTEITVWDADGSTAIYRDTGCEHHRVEGATAMIDASTVDRALLSRVGEACE
jgi:hypothetical protein